MASDAPAPGGGSASALSAAMGASLTSMVAALTLGKPKYAEFEQLAKEIVSAMNKLRKELADAVDRDTEAYNGVGAVFAMPKATDEEKAARKQAMQDALKQATLVPLEVMRLALAGLELTASCVGKTNPNAASDLGVASLTLLAGVKGAWLNVLINLSGVTDDSFVRDCKAKGGEMFASADTLAGEVYSKVETSL